MELLTLGPRLTSISCTCSSLVMYICCRESSSSLFLSNRVFPSSAARWRSRERVGGREKEQEGEREIKQKYKLFDTLEIINKKN